MIKTKEKIIAVLALSSIGTSISYASGFNDVSVNIDGVTYEYTTRETVVDDFLNKEQIVLKNGDQVDIGLRDKIEDDMEININRLKTIYLNGDKYQTNATTIVDFFKENNIVLKDTAFKNFKKNQKIKNGIKLEYKETKTRFIKSEATAEKNEVVEYDPNLEYGKEKFVEGKDGKKEITKKLVMNNVDVVSEDVIREKIVVKPVDDKKIIGSKETVDEDIPFDTEEKIDYNLDKGESYIEQEGTNGTKTIVYDHRGNDKKVLSEETTKEPINKVVVVGGKNTNATNLSYAPIDTDFERIHSSAKEEIARRESGGSYTARNGRYIGRYQLDSSYLGGDYSPENQERVADNYVAGRYGSWEAALDFWNRNGWY